MSPLGRAVACAAWGCGLLAGTTACIDELQLYQVLGDDPVIPTFHQLDVRVDKEWIRSRATITAYLDVQNVYNRQNVEAWVYQPGFRDRRGAVGMPIFPSLGLRVDF